MSALLEAARKFLAHEAEAARGSYREWNGRRWVWNSRIWEKHDPVGYKLAKDLGQAIADEVR